MALCVSLLAAGCATPAASRATATLDVPVLAPVTTWAIQLQGFDAATAATRLAQANVDMLVIEAMRSQRGEDEFPMRDVVQRVQQSRGSALPGKRCLAYLNVGQAEDYRRYWTESWRAPTATTVGEPTFLLGLDPDGWRGNFPVAYWRPEWRRCLWGHPDAPLDQILADGFDGIYADWVLGFLDPGVRAAAAADGVDPAAAMVQLLADLRSYARAQHPLFVVVAQNALALVEQRPELIGAVDAFAQEDLSFRGLASATWNDAGAGDIPAAPAGESTASDVGERLRALRARGLPVFTLDYALQPDNVAVAIARSRALGLVPCVSRTPLDRLPPP